MIAGQKPSGSKIDPLSPAIDCHLESKSGNGNCPRDDDRGGAEAGKRDLVAGQKGGQVLLPRFQQHRQVAAV